MNHLCGTTMASQTSVKSPQEVLGNLLTLHKFELRSQVGPPSVHHKVIGFNRKRVSERYGQYSGSLSQRLLFWQFGTASPGCKQRHRSETCRDLIRASADLLDEILNMKPA
jgi:hypothetical protein